MSKQLEEQIKECDDKIKLYSDKKTKLVKKLKEINSIEEEKNFKKMTKMLSNLGIKTPEQLEEYFSTQTSPDDGHEEINENQNS